MATETKRRAPATRPARRRGPEANPGSKSAGKQRLKRGPKAHGTQRAKSAAPKRLIAAAQDLVRDHGYESLSVGEVWKRAGVSHQTFYNHFADKRAVVCAGEDEQLAGLERIVREAERLGRPWAGELAASLERALSDLHGSSDTPRARLVAAMGELAATGGLKAATIPALTRKACVSPGEFHRHFTDRRDCLAAAVGEAAEALQARLDTAGAPAAKTPSAVARRLRRLIDHLAADRSTARLLLVEAGALTSPATEATSGRHGPHGWAGSLRELIEGLLAPLAEASDGEPGTALRIAAGALVEGLRGALLAGDPEDPSPDLDPAELADAGDDLTAACRAPLIGAAAAVSAAREAAGRRSAA